MNKDTPWVVWLAATLIAFLALELPALHGDQSHTLSARLRVWLGISPSRPFRHALVPVFCAVLLAFPVWLIAHLLG